MNSDNSALRHVNTASSSGNPNIPVQTPIQSGTTLANFDWTPGDVMRYGTFSRYVQDDYDPNDPLQDDENIITLNKTVFPTWSRGPWFAYAEHTVTDTNTNTDTDYKSIVGWADSYMFFSTYRRTGTAAPNVDIYVIGEIAETVPMTGDIGTYKGGLAGFIKRAGDSDGDPIIGQATLKLESNGSGGLQVDVDLFPITNLEKNVALASVGWDDVAVTGTTFATGGLSGGFFRPNSSDGALRAAGVFDRFGVIGAFGVAKDNTVQ